MPVRIPSYRLHKPTGQAVVTLNGRDRYLGKHGTAESRRLYDRVIAEYLATRARETAAAPPPASRKTPVFRGIVTPIENYERSLAGQAKPIAAEKRTELAIKQKMLEEIERRISKTDGPEHDELFEKAKALAKEIASTTIPEIPRLIADDTTPEKLVSLMALHGGRIGILSPEGGIFGIMAGRYSASRNATNLAVYLKGHAGDTLRVDRTNRPSELIDGPALTLGLAVQPDVIRGLAENPSFRGQGLLGRILYAMPRSRVGHRDVNAPPVPPAIRDAYHAKMRAMLELPFGTSPNGAPAPHVLSLSSGANTLWMQFAAWLEPQLADFGPLSHIADWAGKLAGAVARIAGLLHLADRAGSPEPWAMPIPKATMARAVAIGQYLIPHARAAFSEMGADSAVADARHVLAWIRRHGAESFTRRDCFEGTKSRFGLVENLLPALQLLERHHYVRERTASDPGGRGRPPSPVYLVNPATFRASTTPDAVPPNIAICAMESGALKNGDADGNADGSESPLGTPQGDDEYEEGIL
jgi:hypothetical protein